MAEILIGFMGAGKTSVGIQLAKALNKPFIDLDSEEYARIKQLAEGVVE